MLFGGAMERWESLEERNPGSSPLSRVPELAPHLELLWQCFTELDGCRGYTEAGPQSIRPGDVRDWAQVHGLDEGTWLRDAWAVIRRVDRERLRMFDEQRNSERNKVVPKDQPKQGAR